MDLVSIILPVYNEEKHIEECIKSLLTQTYQNIELIFVDDGSTDNSGKIINTYQKKYPNIKYIYQKNQKQGAARNNGLSQANGKYICFIDSDDFTDKNMIKEMYEFANENDYDITLCDYYISYGTYKELVNTYYKPFKDNKNVTVQEYLLSSVSPWNKMFKKDFLINNKFKFIEKIFYEDYASIPTLANFNPKIGYIEKPFLYYVQSENSTMRNGKSKDYYSDIFKASEHLYNNLKSNKNLHDELEYLIIYHLLYNSSIEFNNNMQTQNLLKINKFMKEKFPKWYKNKYFKEQNIKFKVLCYLFYHNQAKIINKVKEIKKKYENTRK